MMPSALEIVFRLSFVCLSSVCGLSVVYLSSVSPRWLLLLLRLRSLLMAVPLYWLLCPGLPHLSPTLAWPAEWSCRRARPGSASSKRRRMSELTTCSRIHFQASFYSIRVSSSLLLSLPSLYIYIDVTNSLLLVLNCLVASLSRFHSYLSLFVSSTQSSLLPTLPKSRVGHDHCYLGSRQGTSQRLLGDLDDR